MTNASPIRDLHDLTIGSGFSIEDLVSRTALGEVMNRVGELFDIPLRLLGSNGTMLADYRSTPPLYEQLSTEAGGRRVLREVVEAVKTAPVEGEMVTLDVCPTGMSYVVSPIIYDGRVMGRVVAGPFMSPSLVSPPQSLLEVDRALDAKRLGELWEQNPRVEVTTVERMVRHLRAVLDLVLFSGHRALLASSMHLASIQESYRELREKTTRLEEAYERLRELDRLKSNFLATVSHELRTPLTSIIGYSEMLTAGIAGDLTTEQREFVQTIQEKGVQLLELIKGLLDLTKLESGTLIIRRTEVAVGPILQDVAQTLTPVARAKGVELRVEADPAISPVWGESARLRQVFLNLADNAIKFTPAGGMVKLSVALVQREVALEDEGPAVVLCRTKRPMVEVRVADTGIGIAQHERERVFDPFYQVDSSSTREQGGTGLGLSIVKRLVDAHNGSIEIESGVPRGTVFVVTLPCRRMSGGG